MNKNSDEDVKESAALEGYCCKDRACDGLLLYDSGIAQAAAYGVLIL